jgi:hypothetical protein
MKIRRNWLLAGVAIGLVAFGIGASRTVAQVAFRGSFTLPYEVHWNNSVLPAGDYTFTLQSTRWPARMILQGPNGSTFIQAMAISDHNTSQHSTLTVQRRGGARFVRDLYLADYGRSLSYWEPKVPTNEKLLSQGPTTTEHVLISTGK